MHKSSLVRLTEQFHDKQQGSKAQKNSYKVSPDMLLWIISATKLKVGKFLKKKMTQ